MTILINGNNLVKSTRFVQKFAKKSEKVAEKITRGAAISLFRSIIEQSPVDTGRFRANWFTTLKEPSTQITKGTGRNSVGLMTQRILSANKGDSFTLANNLPYAQELENGHSTQSPPFAMVRKNVRKFPRYLRDSARENGK